MGSRAVGSRSCKLGASADDLKSGLENEVKERDREIEEGRRTAALSATLEEKLS